MINVAILVGGKGRGSNMRALAEACAAGVVPARVALVVAPDLAAPACATAAAMGIAVTTLSPADPDYADKLLCALDETDARYICLAGYLRLLPDAVLRAFPDRVLNIHPALLPKYGGKGMYGMHVHQKVIDQGERESGCSVHLVNERYDEGRVLLQLRCPVFPDDTPERLAARVLALEHEAYPTALKRLVEGDLK